MEEILKLLNIDDRIIKIISGNYKIFTSYSAWNYGNDNKDINDSKEFPTPPFYIPILINYDSSPISYGFSHHFFTEREFSYGYMEFGDEFGFGEIGRTFQQFIDYILINLSIDLLESEENSIISNQKLFELTSNLTREKIISFSSTENTNSYLNLTSFSESCPIWVFNSSNINQYQGDFPCSENLIIEKNVEQACFCEIAHKEWIGYPPPKQAFSLFKKKPKYQPLTNIPEWLRPETNKQELFEKYMLEQEYGKAWLTINGPGFTPREVGERMQRLKAFSEEKAYQLWADFWCEKYGEQDSFIFM